MKEFLDNFYKLIAYNIQQNDYEEAVKNAKIFYKGMKTKRSIERYKTFDIKLKILDEQIKLILK